MPDVADMAQEIEGEHLNRALARHAAPIPVGQPGECENCGEDMPRLVGGLCGFCRDGRIPDRRVTAVASEPKPPAPVAIPAPAPRAAPPPAPEPAMSKPKTVCLPASAAIAITAIETRAREMEIPLGQAAAELIALGAGEVEASPAEPDQPPRTPRQRMVAALDVIASILIEQIERADVAEASGKEENLGAAVDRAEQAERRAEAAEARLAQIKAAFA